MNFKWTLILSLILANAFFFEKSGECADRSNQIIRTSENKSGFTFFSQPIEVQKWKREYFSKFASNEIEVLDENLIVNRKPFTYFGLKGAVAKVIGWSPSGRPEVQDKQCQFSAKLKPLEFSTNPFQFYTNTVENILQNPVCQEELAINDDSRIGNISKSIAMLHEIKDNRFLQRIQFHFPDGANLNGILAL